MKASSLRKKTAVMLLAGGAGTRLNIMGRSRAKPAVPFAGMYRIIDFTLSNVMNSGLTNVGVLTQYKPISMMGHIGTGAPWDFIGEDRFCKILPPHTGTEASDWYKGTADAVWQNIDYLRSLKQDRVIILSGDHIYRMDYAKMLAFHDEKGADITVAVMKVPWEDVVRFGIAVPDETGRVVDFVEKIPDPPSNTASLGIYVFNMGILDLLLKKIIGSGKGNDFGKHIFPYAFPRYKVFAYPFEGYWKDVGTIQAYWETHMDILDPDSELDLDRWQVYTNPEDRNLQKRAPAFCSPQAVVQESLISRGCFIDGHVERSVLSPGVRVEQGAKVTGCVLLHDVVVRRGAVLDRVVSDKDTVFDRGCLVGYGSSAKANKQFPDHLHTGVVLVGKGARIPVDSRIGRNCIIYPGAKKRQFPSLDLPAGSTVIK